MVVATCSLKTDEPVSPIDLDNWLRKGGRGS